MSTSPTGGGWSGADRIEPVRRTRPTGRLQPGNNGPSSEPGARATPLGVAAVLTAITGFSLLNVIVKLSRAPALTFAFDRLWLGAAVMAIVSVVARRRLSWTSIRASIAPGVLFGLNIALFVSALKRTSVADVLIIGALQPALTMLVAGRLFGERLTGHHVAWTAVSVGGVVLVTVGSSGTPVWSLSGDLLAVGSLLAFTVYFLVSKSVRRQVPAIEYMTAVTLIAAIVVTPLTLLSGQRLPGLRWQDAVWLGLFVLGAQGGHVLLAWAHAQVDVSVSSLMILAEPIIAAVAALVVLGEPIRPLEIAGGVVVIVSVGAILRRATTSGTRSPSGQSTRIER
jgi:drug/metabolite transporter (DMT)-like permease